MAEQCEMRSAGCRSQRVRHWMGRVGIWEFYETLGDLPRGELTPLRQGLAAICDLRQEVNSGAVSYTHLDVYKRQANLGALLMATGHGYDSESGRQLAAAITSLMTGAAYRRSAELAAVVGPYDGYARNAAAHNRVMRKHQSANDPVSYTHLDVYKRQPRGPGAGAR